MKSLVQSGLLAFLLAASIGCDMNAHSVPFATAVLAFAPGQGAGFGQDQLPDVVLGPPQGGGDRAGSLDVLSLGAQGEIALELGTDVVDAVGPDLVVFENPFRAAGGRVFTEFGQVSVSMDGTNWTSFPCDIETGEGCAGKTPVQATNAADATDPAKCGGDAFDLSAIDVDHARFVRVQDVSGSGTGENVGFDLDAVAVFHPALN